MKIADEIKNIKSGKKELREFGIVMGVFFTLLAILFWWRGKNFIFPLIIAIPFSGLALSAPLVLKPVQKIWMTLALLIGWVMTRVILTILFYLVITPISIITRLTGKEHLDLAFKKPEKSYWIPKPQKPFNKEIYEKQF